MMPESEFAKKIATYLTAGTTELKPGVAYRLQQARAAALARLAQPDKMPAVERELSMAGPGYSRGPRRNGSPSWRWVAAAVLLLGIVAFGWQQWQAYMQAKEFEELDAQILSSDLPIDAYLDRGFQNWLKTSYER
jgi:hypothetical protein